MMKKLFCTLLIVLGAVSAKGQPLPAHHDIPKNDPGLKYGIQFTAEARKKVNPFWEFHAGGEFRMRGDFLYDKQIRGNLGVEYKHTKKFSLLADYTYCGIMNNGDDYKSRHRLEAGAKETFKLNRKFKLIFTEKLGASYKTWDINKYQTTRLDIFIKLRARLQWNLSKKFDLFTYLELKTTFREPNLTNLYYDQDIMQFTDASGSPVGDKGWFLEGFDKIRINRLRNAIGADYKLAKGHKLRLTVLYDYETELDIDANKQGTVIKSLVYDRRNLLYGRLGYFFSF